MLFVVSKTNKDCFLCFSKLKNIKYSIWQYVRFIYTEQMIRIRRNAYLLSVLQQKEPGKMVMLDDEDYMEPDFCIAAHKAGIDMEFMVRYVGGDYISDSVSDSLRDKSSLSDNFTNVFSSSDSGNSKTGVMVDSFRSINNELIEEEMV